jgi:hypothetical protein
MLSFLAGLLHAISRDGGGGGGSGSSCVRFLSGEESKTVRLLTVGSASVCEEQGNLAGGQSRRDAAAATPT